MAQKAIWVRRGTPPGAETDGFGSRSLEEPSEVRRRRIAAEIDSRIDHLPPFPTVLSELIGLTTSSKSAAGDLRTCIEKDPVLAARVLRLANSAFYCPRVPVTSVQQGVVMLGHLSVKSLAMAAATLKFLDRGIDAYGIPAGGLWMHSYAVAELSRNQACALKWPDETQDAVHVGGLLHDIGKIVLVEILPVPSEGDETPKVGGPSRAVEQWEEDQTGFTHSRVGQRIAEKWRLAPLTTSCIGFHHGWDAAPSDFTQQVALVSLADVGARKLGMGLEEPEESPDVEGRALELLGIEMTTFTETVESWREKIGDAKDLFSNLGGEA